MATKVHSVFKVQAEGRSRLIVLDTQDLSVGRAPENDLSIDDVEMSRKHAVFRRTPEGCRVEDQRTSNGTEVNGESVDHAMLKHGDVIRIGEVEITYAVTQKNPATLGAGVEYASQLKSFGSPLAGSAGASTSGEATILGAIGDLGSGDESFEVQPAGDFDFGLHEDGPAAGDAPRDLDAELSDLDGGLDLDPGATAAAEAKTVPATRKVAPQPAAPAPEPAPPKLDAWELDDVDDAPAKTGPLAITLEIDGLDAGLRRTLEGLLGKTIQLPGMRVRIKGRDLG